MLDNSSFPIQPTSPTQHLLKVPKDYAYNN